MEWQEWYQCLIEVIWVEVISIDLFRAMSPTNSSLVGLIGTPLKVALFPRCTMHCTYSSLLGFVGTLSLVTASFILHLWSMRHTNSSLNNLIGTPLVAASFLGCSMSDTNSPTPWAWLRQPSRLHRLFLLNCLGFFLEILTLCLHQSHHPCHYYHYSCCGQCIVHCQRYCPLKFIIIVDDFSVRPDTLVSNCFYHYQSKEKQSKTLGNIAFTWLW
jgi:hypothetical protein